jgi:L-amino acid N-acyltransferase YncA
MTQRSDRVTSPYRIRKAANADLDALIAFTLAEAREAEHLELDAQAVTRGVSAAFAEPPAALYWVAETVNSQIVASTSVVTEWSNFHGGRYWWVQSLFIAPQHRGAGLVDLLLDRLAVEAEKSGALELRLYAHSANERAVRAYERCGFTVAPYVIMRRELRRGLAPPTSGAGAI